MPSGDVIIYTRHYMSAGSRGNIVQDAPAHTLRAQARRGRAKREGVVVVAWQAFITATTYLLT